MCKQGLIDPKKTQLLCDFGNDGVFTKIIELTTIPFPTSSWTPAEVTTLDDVAKRIAAAGFIDNGSIEIRGLMISGSTQQNQLFVINRTKACHLYKIVLSDPLHTTFEFHAFITNWSPSNAVGDKARVGFNLAIDGDVRFYNDLGMIWDGMSGGIDPETPQISCEGAINSVGFKYGNLARDPSAIITINGVKVPEKFTTYGEHSLGNFSFYFNYVDGAVGIVSLNDEVVHIKIDLSQVEMSIDIMEMEQTTFDDVWLNSNDNPTYSVDPIAKTIEFCLAPAIGCIPSSFDVPSNIMLNRNATGIGYQIGDFTPVFEVIDLDDYPYIPYYSTIPENYENHPLYRAESNNFASVIRYLALVYKALRTANQVEGGYDLFSPQFLISGSGAHGRYFSVDESPEGLDFVNISGLSSGSGENVGLNVSILVNTSVAPEDDFATQVFGGDVTWSACSRSEQS